jgi:hypothetical protein
MPVSDCQIPPMLWWRHASEVGERLDSVAIIVVVDTQNLSARGRFSGAFWIIVASAARLAASSACFDTNIEHVSANRPGGITLDSISHF